MEIHIQPDLIDDKPDVVVIHAGCNDIPNTSLEPRTIAEGIIKLGKICKNYNTNDIFISSLTCRSRSYLNTRVKSVNGILIDLCKVYKFHYKDNSTWIKLWYAILFSFLSVNILNFLYDAKISASWMHSFLLLFSS